LKKAEKEYNTLCNMYPAKTSKSCISADIHAAESEAQVDVVWDTMLINTAIGQFRIPPKYNEILKKIYGDYMSVPPLENRIKEMMYHYAILKRFDRKK
jgi:lipopolysaccharide cholinephosphotransferase